MIQDTDWSRTCSCGKVLKNQRGLKIHRTKMGCPPICNLEQRARQLGETEEELDQEEHHSVQSLQDPDEGEESVEGTEMANGRGAEDTSVRKQRVRWPASAEKAVWNAFDEELDLLMENVLVGKADNKLHIMSEIIYNFGKERFGLEERKEKKNVGGNRRVQKISKLRGDLRRLKNRYRCAEETEKHALTELRNSLRNEIQNLRRAENLRRKRHERQRKRAQFTRNPFQFVKHLLGENKSGELCCTKEEADQYIKEMHSDNRRHEDLGECETLITPESPVEEFDCAEPRLKEVRDIVKKARASSAPGPNGVSYKVYKNCPKILLRFWKLIKVMWRKGELCREWLKAEGCFIPKEEGSTSLNQFRTISLLNVEGKILLAVLSRRMTSYLLKNKYIDTAVQKGGVPGVSGCIEHTSVITQIIKEARENKGDIAVIWLDLANAYGSVPHQLIQKTLQLYHVPDRFRQMLQHYFDGFTLRFSTRHMTTDWHRLEVGIVTGCTISVVLFAAAMNLIVKSAEKISRGPKMASGIIQPPTRAFMDDMTITAKSYVEGRWMLQDIGEIIKWARMKFKPEKSRSLVLRRGQMQESARYRIDGQLIPTVKEQPVKCLGKWFRDSLNDKQSIQDTAKQMEDWLQRVDKSGLPGKFKAWIYQHGILPRLLWPLLIYSVPFSTVEAMERTINSFLRRWMGVPKSFSSLGFYCTGSKLQMPLKSLTEECKVVKARKVIMLRDSGDEKVREAGIQVKTGRKWRADKAVDEAEARLQHSDIVGSVAQGRLGLGYITRARWSKASEKERRSLVQEEVRQMEEESRLTKAVTLRKQGRWLNWEGVQQRKLTWRDIWSMESDRLSFLLKSVYDVLPSPTNLKTWGLSDSPDCKLCGRPANLEHVLSSCRTALSDGRYRWRHDRVLSSIAEHIDQARRAQKTATKGPSFISFVRAGQEGKGANSARGILGTASDWKMEVDLKKQLKFPQEITVTNLRPDMVLWSTSTKQVVMVELTVPWEERIEESFERKRTKYQDLTDSCNEKGWRSWCFPVEVGCRGFPAQSLWRTFSRLGITGQSRKKALSAIARETEGASLWIWRKREEQWMGGHSTDVSQPPNIG